MKVHIQGNEEVSQFLGYLPPGLHQVASESPFVFSRVVLLSRKGAQRPAIFSSWDLVAFPVYLASENGVCTYSQNTYCAGYKTELNFLSGLLFILSPQMSCAF